MLGRGTRFAVQVHAIHQQIGDLNIGFGNAPFRFGQMPHHFKRRREEQRLALLLIGKDVQPAAARAVKHMPD